jgi:hypothetical protein
MKLVTGFHGFRHITNETRQGTAAAKHTDNHIASDSLSPGGPVGNSSYVVSCVGQSAHAQRPRHRAFAVPFD